MAISTLTAMLFSGTLRRLVPLTLVSDRAGLVMENGAKVKLRGVQVGEVDKHRRRDGGRGRLSKLKLKIDAGPFRYLPSNVEAEIKASTAFGAKYVDLIVPDGAGREAAEAGFGAALAQRHCRGQHRVREPAVGRARPIDPAKLNSVLSAVAESVRGKGEVIGQAITDANNVLLAVNPRMETVRQDWQLFGKTHEAYSDAAQDIVSILDSSRRPARRSAHMPRHSTRCCCRRSDFPIGDQHDRRKPAESGARDQHSRSDDALLMKYSPTYTCLFQGAQWFLENGGRDAMGGNGKSVIMDAALLMGDDPYRYPDNLPIVNATGGPGGKPSCGSLPDVSKNFPVKYLVTDTGFGTGLDMRPNPGHRLPRYRQLLPRHQGKSGAA